MGDSEVEPFAVTKWSDLPRELVDMILSKMSSLSIYNFRAVCASWRCAANAYVVSPNCRMLPWLMLSPEQENDDKISFYDLDEKRVFEYRGRPKELDDNLCLGSSYGWLVMLDEKANPYVFHPFIFTRIELPLMETYSDVLSICKQEDDNTYSLELPNESPGPTMRRTFDHVHRLRTDFIKKVVVSANPSQSDFFVLMIFNLITWGATQLAFCHSGDSKWMRLGNGRYDDVVCDRDKFLALNGECVEFWEIVDSSPVKVSELRFAETPEVTVSLPVWTYLSLKYLVKSSSSGDLLLIERYVHYFESYGTRFFRIFRLNLITNEREEVESLGDHVLFLGGNQSELMSVENLPGFEGNCIYFIEDDWESLYDYPLDYDIGVFNVEEKTIKSFCPKGIHHKNEPPPFWFDPISFLVP